MQTLFSWFGKGQLKAFATFVLEVCKQEGFHGEDIEAESTFEITRYVLGRFLPLLEEYSDNGCFIREQKLWPRKIERVYRATRLDQL